MEKRHIVLISQIPLWSMGKAVGGPALFSTITALGKQYRVSLVTPQLDYVDPKDIPEGVTPYFFKHHLHGVWRTIKKLGWITDTLGWYTFRWSAWKIVQRLCQQGDVDLVYGYEVYGVPVAKKAQKRFGLPMVARYQGTLMSERRYMPLQSIRFWKHIRALKTPADLYIMTNDGTLGDQVLKDYGMPEDKILFLVNGVDKSIKDRPWRDLHDELGIPQDKHILLTLSRLAFWKRVDRSIRTLKLLRDRGHDVELVSVGMGHEEQRLKDLVASLGLEEHVHWIGGVGRDDIVSYYRTCTVFLTTNDFTNLVNPIFEAMVLGVPLVALNTGGTATVVKDGVNGILLDDFSEDAIADAVDGLLSDTAERERLARDAAAWAEENLYGWDKRTHIEIDALERLMDEHSAQRRGAA